MFIDCSHLTIILKWTTSLITTCADVETQKHGLRINSTLYQSKVANFGTCAKLGKHFYSLKIVQVSEVVIVRQCFECCNSTKMYFEVIKVVESESACIHHILLRSFQHKLAQGPKTQGSLLQQGGSISEWISISSSARGLNPILNYSASILISKLSDLSLIRCSLIVPHFTVTLSCRTSLINTCTNVGTKKHGLRINSILCVPSLRSR